MRRHPPSNNNSSSRGARAANPLLLCGVALLLFAIWRVCSIHGDLHELHESLNKPSSGSAAQAAPPADVQVGRVQLPVSVRHGSGLCPATTTSSSNSSNSIKCEYFLMLLLLLQVIMPEDEDVLFRNATNKPLKVILVRLLCCHSVMLAPLSPSTSQQVCSLLPRADKGTQCAGKNSQPHSCHPTLPATPAAADTSTLLSAG
jgi:hypothetical protein